MRVAFLAAGAVLITALSGAGEARAQQSMTDKLYACIGMTDAQARLACYDAAVGELKQAQSQGDVAVVSRADVQQARKDSFGFSAPPQASVTAAITAPAAAEPEIDNVKVTITGATKRADGKYRFTLDNGQVWDQTDTVKLRLLPDAPFAGEIRKAALGSFFLKPADKTAVRVKRVK
jgi:hypothetical protein